MGLYNHGLSGESENSKTYFHVIISLCSLVLALSGIRLKINKRKVLYYITDNVELIAIGC